MLLPAATPSDALPRAEPVQKSVAHADQAALRSPALEPLMSPKPDTDEKRLRLAMDYALDAVWDWNLPDKTAHFSPRLAEMLGYAQDELNLPQARWREHVHP